MFANGQSRAVERIHRIHAQSFRQDSKISQQLNSGMDRSYFGMREATRAEHFSRQPGTCVGDCHDVAVSSSVETRLQEVLLQNLNPKRETEKTPKTI